MVCDLVCHSLQFGKVGGKCAFGFDQLDGNGNVDTFYVFYIYKTGFFENFGTVDQSNAFLLVGCTGRVDCLDRFGEAGRDVTGFGGDFFGGLICRLGFGTVLVDEARDRRGAQRRRFVFRTCFGTENSCRLSS